MMPEVNGTSYGTENQMLINIFEWARRSRESGRWVRLCVYYGDVATGQAWGDRPCGYIGRSTGSIKIPLLITLRTSRGGDGLLDHCVVKVTYANKREGGVLYQHPMFREGVAL